MTQSIAEKIDELLKDDKTFTTRSGLRFLTELLKDAFEYIEAEKKRQQDTDTVQSSIIIRVSNVEKSLSDFLKAREIEQDKAEEERKWWRRIILGTMLTLLLSNLIPELIKLFGG